MESSVASAEPSPVSDSLPDADLVAEPEKPLNAEEATVIVLDFLRRLGKNVSSPRSAILKGDTFVVEVDLKRAAATVQVNSETREITEYSIASRAEEAKPLPIPSRKILLMAAMAASVLGIYTLMVFNFLKIPMIKIPFNRIFGIIAGSSDLLILGGLGLIPVIVIIWWRRRGAS